MEIIIVHHIFPFLKINALMKLRYISASISDELWKFVRVNRNNKNYFNNFHHYHYSEMDIITLLNININISPYLKCKLYVGHKLYHNNDIMVIINRLSIGDKRKLLMYAYMCEKYYVCNMLLQKCNELHQTLRPSTRERIYDGIAGISYFVSNKLKKYY